MTDDPTGLVDFLLACITEDEDIARAATLGPWYDDLLIRRAEDYAAGVFNGRERAAIARPADATHIARHDPTRALAECEAKRQIVRAYLDERTRRDAYQAADARAVEDEEQARRRRSSAARCRGLEIALGYLALPYADRAGYRQEWAP